MVLGFALKVCMGLGVTMYSQVVRQKASPRFLYEGAVVLLGEVCPS